MVWLGPVSWPALLWDVARGGLYWSFAKQALAYSAAHTGLPALVIGAAALVIGWRVLKRVSRFLVEVAVVAGLLAAAAHAGWIVW